VGYCRGKAEVYDPVDEDPKRWGPWTVKTSLAKLGQLLASKGTIPASAKLDGLSVPDEKRTGGGRAKSVALKINGDGVKNLDGERLRSYLGMKSTLYYPSVDPSSGAVLFTGRGFGHGVGMSQHGAQMLAQFKGWDYRQILQFYFTEIDVCSAGTSKFDTSAIPTPL
jgi:stage II sporulation protein D